MKQAFIFVFTLLFICACNDKTGSPDVKKASTAEVAARPAENFDYPYTLEQPYNDWQPGDQQHAVNVMKSLKAYENGDIDACMTAFGDSVSIMFDGYRAKLSNDSLKKFFASSRGALSSMKIKMGDWESVISKDKKSEYVTLWYKEIQTDKKGKTDSLSVVNDLKIINGKIAELDEKIQHFPAKKK